MLKWLYGLIRPICPHCDGEGGGMSGYYEPEWSGCRCCDPDERRTTDEETRPLRVWRWRLWRIRYDDWQTDRWIEREVEKMKREDSASQ